MKSHFAVMLGLFAWSTGATLSLASPGTPSAESIIATDEATVVRAVDALRHPDASVRAKAAEDLRTVIARYPSGTTDLRRPDAGRAFWEERLARIKPGMMSDDVRRLLDDPERAGTIGSGQSHISGYRLDDHWIASVTYTSPDAVVGTPRLERSERPINVAVPARFTGTWMVYFVNGQKAYSISYRNGAYDGPFNMYHDNGKLAVQQHYRAGVADGSDRGCYADGKPMYSGQYRNGKQDGTWVQWYPAGQARSVVHFVRGRKDGMEAAWYQNGQMTFVKHYKDGVQNGEDAGWKPDGHLNYRHSYVNGQIQDVIPLSPADG